MAINQRAYDWESLRVQLPSGAAIQLQSITYEDGKEKDLIYGAGATPQATGHGDYSAAGSLELRINDAVKLETALNVLSGLRGFYNAPPIPIALSYANVGQSKQRVLLVGCEITKRRNDSKRGAKMKTRSYDFIMKNIITNGQPAIV